jgi:hypothetical protein
MEMSSARLKFIYVMRRWLERLRGVDAMASRADS